VKWRAVILPEMMIFCGYTGYTGYNPLLMGLSMCSRSELITGYTGYRMLL
jgi:hypothetical protein